MFQSWLLSELCFYAQFISWSTASKRLTVICSFVFRSVRVSLSFLQLQFYKNDFLRISGDLPPILRTHPFASYLTTLDTITFSSKLFSPFSPVAHLSSGPRRSLPFSFMMAFAKVSSLLLFSPLRVHSFPFVFTLQSLSHPRHPNPPPLAAHAAYMAVWFVDVCEP